jgi:transposase
LDSGERNRRCGVLSFDLTRDAREHLAQLVRKGRPSTRMTSRAHDLMLAHAGEANEEIRTTLPTSVSTIYRILACFPEEGLDTAQTERKRSGTPPRWKADRKHRCWHWPAVRLRLLADRSVKLRAVPATSDETVRLRRESSVKPWLKKRWLVAEVSSSDAWKMYMTYMPSITTSGGTYSRVLKPRSMPGAGRFSLVLFRTPAPARPPETEPGRPGR